MFKNDHILKYAFNKLKSEQKETLKLSALALSRLGARLDDSNSENFINNLKSFKDFEKVVFTIQNIGNPT